MVSFGIFLPKPCLFAVRWHNSGFSRLLGDDMSDILVPGWGVRVGSAFTYFWFFYGFRTCRVGHLERACLIPHIPNFRSKFSKTSATLLPDVTYESKFFVIVLLILPLLMFTEQTPIGKVNPDLYQNDHDDDWESMGATSQHMGRLWFSVEFNADTEDLHVIVIKAFSKYNRSDMGESSRAPNLC